MLKDAIGKPLSIISERSWRTGEVPEDWTKGNSSLPCPGEAVLGVLCPELVLVREKGLESSSLEILKRHLEHDPVQLAPGEPIIAGGFDYDLQKSLPIPIIL